MIRAVFVDYMGTLVQDDSQYTQKVIGRCVAQSKGALPKDIAKFWFGLHDTLMEESNGADYRIEYSIARQTFELAMDKFGFKDDPDALCAILEQHWMYAPAFHDTADFFEKCPVPIYVVSSNDTKYIETGMECLGLHPAGIISSEMAKAYKPNKDIYLKALSVADCCAGEVIHIGDSIRADVKGALNAGITPWLLDRKGEKECQNVKILHSLHDALDELNRIHAL